VMVMVKKSGGLTTKIVWVGSLPARNSLGDSIPSNKEPKINNTTALVFQLGSGGVVVVCSFGGGSGSQQGTRTVMSCGC